MDLVSLAREKKNVTLLSLPTTDLKSPDERTSTSSNALIKNTDESAQNQENQSPGTGTTTRSSSSTSTSNSELVLMQLPKGMQISDLLSGCHFVAPTSTISSTGTHSKQAALVVESKNQSYSISRLETSNVLILVPPVRSATSNSSSTSGSFTYNNNIASNNNNEKPPPNKKSKMDGSLSSPVQLIPVPARLLKPGGSGASFLELRPTLLRPWELAKILNNHVFDPYNNISSNNNNNNNIKRPKNRGRTIPSLAVELQASRGQIQDALILLQSFPMPPKDPNSNQHKDNNDDAASSSALDEVYFGVLSEEALQEAQNAIISTLAESDDCADYNRHGIDSVDDFITQVLDRFPLDQTYPEQEHVIRHALLLFEKDGARNGQETQRLKPGTLSGRIVLDVKKIAICLAHRLFQSQTRPWEEKRLCLRWNSELPGVGKQYQTTIDMLRGIAIPVNPSSSPPKKSYNYVNDDGSAEEEEQPERLWKYLPATKLPLQPDKRFAALFGIQSQWTFSDLSPYLEGLVKQTGLTEAELLLQYTAHTKSTEVDEHGKPIKMYSYKG